MIYVINNGGIYSDRCIRFVESDLDADDMKAIIAHVEYDSAARIEFAAERVEWFEGEPQYLAEYCAPVGWRFAEGRGSAILLNRCTPGDFDDEDFKPLSADLWKRLIESIERSGRWYACFADWKTNREHESADKAQAVRVGRLLALDSIGALAGK